MKSENKRIFVNTGIVYARLIVITIIGLLTSRFVLQALGAYDYGLYSVVGGLIAMLGILSVAMQTTTRRYINVEMGKIDGNLNRIFNISRILHIGFAVFVLVIAESIGMYYIYTYLNVDAERIPDAVFCFQVSTIAAVIGIVNVPNQAMLVANEKFFQLAVFDIVKAVAILIFVVFLGLSHEENTLRIYAMGMSLLTLLSLVFYNVACFVQWRNVVKFKFYRGWQQYKEILFFNNYVSLGALAYMCRTQGANILINYFFGTIVNASFSIGYIIEAQCMNFVTNIGSAAAPQITRNYENNYQRSIFLTAFLQRFSIYLMLLLAMPIFLEMHFILELWLKKVPDGTVLISQLTLLSALVRITFGGRDKLVHASGKIKWFQITESGLLIACIPLSFILYKLGFPTYTVIVVFIGTTIFNCFLGFYLMKKILAFDVLSYFKAVYKPVVLVLMGCLGLIFVYRGIPITTTIAHFSGAIFVTIATAIVIYLLGFDKNEKQQVINLMKTCAGRVTNRIK